MNRKEMLLVKLTEEASEIAQAAAKCCRFGSEEIYPLIGEGVMPLLSISKSDRRARIAKIETYLDYSRKCGTLDE